MAIEVTRVNEEREIQAYMFPDISRMTVLDGALGLLNDSGDELLAAYAEGEWIAARVVDEVDDG